MKRSKKKRRAVESSCDDEEDGLDVQKEEEPVDNTLQESKHVNEADFGQLRLSDMNTQPSHRPPAAPGKKWVRVTKTE